MASLQSARRRARAEPRFIEVVRFRGQSRPSRYQGLGHLVRRRLAARDVAVHGVNQLGDARVALGDLRVALGEGDLRRLRRLLLRRNKTSRELQREALDARPEGVSYKSQLSASGLPTAVHRT